MSERLTPAAVGAVDRAGLIADALELPTHLHDALWRAESARLPAHDSPGGLLVCGVGGSAIGGDLAAAALGDRASRPVRTNRDYALPPWTTPDTTIVCASYTGNTEETLACYEAAGALGALRVAVTSGGELAEQARADGVPVVPVPGVLQPRAAVAYLTVAVLEVAVAAGAGPALHSEIDVTAAHLRACAATWGPSGPADGLAKRLALRLHGSVPVIVGAGITAPIAYRWKTQINENAKVPCFASALPEIDHNEIEGWPGGEGVARLAALFLDDGDLHPRVRRRIELTARLVAPYAAAVERVASVGETQVERVFSLVLLGDLVSIYLAVLSDTDPTPVASIADLKAELARG